MLEVLKDDDVRIIKLSEKKLLFKTKVKILTSDFVAIDVINLNSRFKINKDGEYQIIGNHKLINILSQKFGVKMEKIYLCYETQIHLGERFDLVTGIRIKDTAWCRDYKLKMLFES